MNKIKGYKGLLYAVMVGFSQVGITGLRKSHQCRLHCSLGCDIRVWMTTIDYFSKFKSIASAITR
jgi:hypothetical protein